MKHRTFKYTKDNGDESLREVLIVSEARQNHLCLDVSNLTPTQVEFLTGIDSLLRETRDELYEEYTKDTGVNLSTLWRSFKPENIEWINDSR